MKLNLFANISGNLGYNVHAQGFSEGLLYNDMDLCIVPYDLMMSSPLSRRLMECTKKPFHYEAPSVSLCYGNNMHRFHGKTRIGYTVCETSRLRDDWVKSLNSLDDVWTVSKFCKNAFENSGVEKDVKIVPEGVDTSVFNKYVTPLKDKPENTFMFLSVFKWEKRKSPDILLRAFSEEFDQNERVSLFLQSYNPFDRNFNPWEEINKLKLNSHAPIYILPPRKTRPEMASLYRTADCFVLPTRGESWGLPLIESMACGVPVITTRWGGSLEFVSDDVGWLIDVESMETPNDGVFFAPYENNEWAVPSKKHLRELMRYAFEHRDECSKKGSLAYELVDGKFTWEKSTEGVPKLLKDL